MAQSKSVKLGDGSWPGRESADGCRRAKEFAELTGFQGLHRCNGNVVETNHEPASRDHRVGRAKVPKGLSTSSHVLSPSVSRATQCCTASSLACDNPFSRSARLIGRRFDDAIARVHGKTPRDN
jgi:hypothetical protein